MNWNMYRVSYKSETCNKKIAQRTMNIIDSIPVQMQQLLFNLAVPICIVKSLTTFIAAGDGKIVFENVEIWLDHSYVNKSGRVYC